jgi:hypothetical protein
MYNIIYRMEFEKQLQAQSGIIEYVEFIEKLNPITCKQLLQSTYIHDDEKKPLINYFKLYDSDTSGVHITYHKNKSKFGRYYENPKGKGFTPMRKVIRNLLTGELYYDLDLSTCHPSIFLSIFESEFPNKLYDPDFLTPLHYYVKNRDKTLNTLRKYYKITYDKNIDKDDPAKELISRVCNGGSVDSWLKEFDLEKPEKDHDFIIVLQEQMTWIYEWIEKNNKEFFNWAKQRKLDKGEKNFKGSVLSFYGQEQEVRIIKFVLKKLWEFNIFPINTMIGSYEFDGLKLHKKEIDDFGGIDKFIESINSLLPKYISFKNKEIKQYIDVSNIIPSDTNTNYIIEPKVDAKERVKELGGIILEIGDDKKAGELLFKEFNNQVFYCNSEFYLKDNNILSCVDEKFLFSYIMGKSELKLYNIVNGGKEYRLYSSKVSCQHAMFESFKTEVITHNRDNEFVNKIWKSNINYLIFTNGIYCFKTKKLYSFDEKPDVLSFVKMNYDYKPERDLEKQNKIKDDILLKLFSSKEEVDYFLYTIQKALTGNVYDIHGKDWITIQGPRDSGKSMIGLLFQNTFQQYYTSMDSSNFILKKSLGESARNLNFLALLEHCRIAFLSESKSTEKIDGDLLKRVTSGGDSHTVRGIYKEERKIVSQSKLFFVLNKQLETDVQDVFETHIGFTLKNKFVVEIDEEKEKINKIGQFTYYTKDDKIKWIINDQDYINSFLHLVLDVEPCDMPAELKEEKQQDIELYSKDTLIKTHYDITFLDSDFVSSKDLQNKLKMNPRNLKPILLEMGCKVGRSQTGGINIRGYTGIKHRVIHSDLSDVE